MKLKYMNTDIEYGNIIHNDGTVSKMAHDLLISYQDGLEYNQHRTS